MYIYPYIHIYTYIYIRPSSLPLTCAMSWLAGAAASLANNGSSSSCRSPHATTRFANSRPSMAFSDSRAAAKTPFPSSLCSEGLYSPSSTTSYIAGSPKNRESPNRRKAGQRNRQERGERNRQEADVNPTNIKLEEGISESKNKGGESPVSKGR